MARPPRGPAGKKPPERRPEIDLLRESGELEHDADIVLLLHRPFGADHAECKVAKNRDGRVGIVRLLFRQEFVAFDEPHDDTGSPRL
jgi:replicative DNA helicase